MLPSGGLAGGERRRTVVTRAELCSAARLGKLVDLPAIGLPGLPAVGLLCRTSVLPHRRATAQHLRPAALELRLSRSRGKKEREDRRKGEREQEEIEALEESEYIHVVGPL